MWHFVDGRLVDVAFDAAAAATFAISDGCDAVGRGMKRGRNGDPIASFDPGGDGLAGGGGGIAYVGGPGRDPAAVTGGSGSHDAFEGDGDYGCSGGCSTGGNNGAECDSMHGASIGIGLTVSGGTGSMDPDRDPMYGMHSRSSF